MIKGLRAALNAEFGGRLTLAKCPDEGTLAKKTSMMCVTHKRNKGLTFTHTILIRRRTARTLRDKPMAQMHFIHELAHAHANPYLISGAEGRTSHFVTELGATLWGWHRFRYLAPKVKLRHLLKEIAGNWHYYTEEVGFGIWEAYILWMAADVGVQFGRMINGGGSWQAAWLVLALAAAYASVIAVAADRRAAKRGLRDFRLEGIW